MKVVLLCAVFLIGSFVKVEAILCRSCSDGHFQGGALVNDDCYDNLSGATTTVTETNHTTSGAYCFSEFTLTDGFVTSVRRDATTGSTDNDTTTTGTPPDPVCTTSFTASGGEVTTCTHSCTSDNCNTIAISNFLPCSTNCSEALSYGYCDYLAGACVCAADRTGSNCFTAATKTYRSCVQCNSETNSNCETLTTATQCPINLNAESVYCTSSKTTLFSASGAVVKIGVTKGCTTKILGTPDVQCAFTTAADPQFTNYREYTCTEICDSNGCNSAVPTGDSALTCVQCTGTTDSAGCATQTTRSPCPTGSNQCYSKAVYLTANKTHHRVMEDPDYYFVSIERGCRTSTTSVNSCSSVAQTSSPNVHNVTCEESCDTAGCNYGWPNRTKCSQCVSDPDKQDGYDSCLFNPPAATSCTKPYQAYCVFADTGISGSLVRDFTGHNGFTRSMIRGCSYHDIGNNCNITTVNGVDYRQCNMTCITDGCNQGNGAATHIQGLLMLSFPALFGYLIQRHLF